jgi:hypothetical protein
MYVNEFFLSTALILGLVSTRQNYFPELLPFFHTPLSGAGFSEGKYPVDDRFYLRGVDELNNLTKLFAAAERRAEDLQMLLED